MVGLGLFLEVEITHFPGQLFLDVDGPLELVIAILEHFSILVLIVHLIVRLNLFLPEKRTDFFSNDHQWLETELQFFAHPLKQVESFSFGVLVEHLRPDLVCGEEETHADCLTSDLLDFECLGL